MTLNKILLKEVLYITVINIVITGTTGFHLDIIVIANMIQKILIV